MKRRISDMLDGYPVQSVDFNNGTPLSPERIKELTMQKINHNEKKGKRGDELWIFEHGYGFCWMCGTLLWCRLMGWIIRR